MFRQSLCCSVVFTSLVFAFVPVSQAAENPADEPSPDQLGEKSTAELLEILQHASFVLDERLKNDEGLEHKDNNPESAFLAHLRTLDAKGLLRVARRIRPVFTEKLLVPQSPIPAPYEYFLDASDTGMNRILERGLFEGLLVPRGGGAYFSFSSGTNDYNQSPDIELQNGKFSSGFYGGNFGVVKLVPERSVVDFTLKEVSADLRDASPKKLYHDVRASRVERPEARAGSLYVVRSVLWDESDLLAAFEVVEKDEYGATIVWRILKTFDVPTR